MRVAVSGSHGSGKSTLIEAFVENHPEYQHEPEAYELLEESFSAEPSAEDFFRQLECHIQQLEKYHSGDRVIIERSPADYVAYLKALVVLHRDNAARQLFDEASVLARKAIHSLDVIVFLSTRDVRSYVPDEEDLELRRAVNDILESLLLHDELDLLSSRSTVVVEASGTLEERIQLLEQVTQQR